MKFAEAMRNDRTKAGMAAVGALGLVVLAGGIATDPLGLGSNVPYVWMTVFLLLGGSFVEPARSTAGNVLVVTTPTVGGVLFALDRAGGASALTVVGLALVVAGFAYHVFDDPAVDDVAEDGDGRTAARGR